MKLAILGSSGFVGSCLFNRFNEKYELSGISLNPHDCTTNICDIRNKRDLEQALGNINPDVIIDSVKLRKSVDYYEKNREEAFSLHVSGIRNIAQWAREREKKLIYISTDYVYPGETNNYNEYSETKPLNYYGELKLQAEKIVKENVLNHAILRSTVIFDYLPGDVNFLMQILNTREKRKVPYDQISNPTAINVLADYVKGIIEKDGRGLFVATGKESINRLEFSLMIADIFNLDKDLFVGVQTSELGQIAKRPLNSATDSSKIRNYLNYECPTLRDSLKEMKKRYELSRI